MPKFRNKETGIEIKENLNFYVEKLRNNPDFEEIKEEKETKNKNISKKNKEEEVESTPQQ